MKHAHGNIRVFDKRTLKVAYELWLAQLDKEKKNEISKLCYKNLNAIGNIVQITTCISP